MLPSAVTAVLIGAGSFEPLYPADPDRPTVTVAAFYLDRTPVTRGDFEAFVVAHPDWQRGRVSGVFADSGYLASWPDPQHAPGSADTPITEVSWFAARAFCHARGARLPTEAEWEYVARASPESFDASEDPAWLAQTLAWYSGGTGTLAAVGQRPANAWGVHDMHGLVWEWVEDFNNTLFGTDGRSGGDEETLRFCGAGAVSATDVADYASFMRYAYRSSLQGRYTTRSLGFRCAADVEAP